MFISVCVVEATRTVAVMCCSVVEACHDWHYYECELVQHFKNVILVCSSVAISLLTYACGVADYSLKKLL